LKRCTVQVAAQLCERVGPHCAVLSQQVALALTGDEAACEVAGVLRLFYRPLGDDGVVVPAFLDDKAHGSTSGSTVDSHQCDDTVSGVTGDFACLSVGFGPHLVADDQGQWLRA